MPEITTKEDGTVELTSSVDDRVIMQLVRLSNQLHLHAQETAQLGLAPQVAFEAHEASHIAARIGSIAYALMEGRLTIREPNDEDLIRRQMADLNSFGPTTAERDYDFPEES